MSDVNPCISEELWFDILLNLPVKTLGICRCVCKSWDALVVSPSFMAAHLKHYTHNDSNSLLLHKSASWRSDHSRYYERYDFYRDLTHFKEANMSNCLHTSLFPFILLGNQGWHFFDLTGSVNGLLCLSNVNRGSSDRSVIWNPLLNKSVLLPKPLYGGFGMKHSMMGFGYNCRKDDHVVVKLSRSGTVTLLAEIYSLQERTWRAIPDNYLLTNFTCSVSSSKCFFNGFIHWVASEKEPDPPGYYHVKWLLRFNVAEETFDMMELPLIPQNPGEQTHVFGIFEYQGKLSLSHWWHNKRNRDSPLSYEIRVHAGNNIWCSILKGSVDGCRHRGPIQYLGMDEELPGLYNTRQNSGLGPFRSDSTRFIAYSESLVLLDHKIDDITVEELRRVPQ